jgi:hypothetical protein
LIIPEPWRVGLAVFALRMASRRCFLTAIAVLALVILLVAMTAAGGPAQAVAEALLIDTDTNVAFGNISLGTSLGISLSLGVPACVSGGSDALLAGADENSWQSRPRHACASSAFHTPSSRLHAPCAIQQQATVMVLLDASAIARNVGRDLVFASSRRAACSHSDLGCANYGAEALSA